MLSPKAQLSLRNAKQYFREHLTVGDYYAAGKQVAGEWSGSGAEKLGLQGAVGEKAFLRLCEGLHPETGERLTQRKNSHRRTAEGKTVANRRVFYDFTIRPPKSVSVVALMQDERIVEAHDRAVRKAVDELERFAETRVRKSGQRSERVTANMVAATFRHDTSRELDPHLHTHCVVFNATFDSVENRWKALEASGMYRAQKFVENYYYHGLARGLRGLVYEIENSPTGFEIKGVPASVVGRFSKRHRQIDAETAKRLEKGGTVGNEKDVREQVARDARKRKVKDATAESLRPHWARQLEPGEVSALAAVRPVSVRPRESLGAADVVAWADEHLFERRSVVNDHELMSAALARGRGADIELSAIREAIESRGYVRASDGRKLTSREVLRCELEIVLAAREGRGRRPALARDQNVSNALSIEQRAAVRSIFASHDFITLFRGGAGTGKCFTLKEAERGIAASGRTVVVLAPQRQQVGDLQRDGLAAETLAAFLQRKSLARGSVVILDEAGQVGGKDLRELVRTVKASAGRIILSGDTRQHGAVAASDALRAIEKHSRLKPIEISEIRRQDPALGATRKERAFIRGYRSAVKAAAAGDIADSFGKLDQLGCVREVAGEFRREALASEYLAAIDRNEKARVVAPTREEARAVNERIRDGMRAVGGLGAGKELTTYQAIDLSEAEKRDPRFAEPGRFMHFHRGYGRFAKGDIAEIAASNDKSLVLVKDGRQSSVGHRYVDRLTIAAASAVEVAPGDRLQLKFNGKSREGAPLCNGELVTVRKVQADGAIRIEGDDGALKTLAPSQRFFTRGFAVTSYGSQGKTVDTVILSDDGNRAATNANQWYVSPHESHFEV